MIKKIGRWVTALFTLIGLFSTVIVATPVSEYLAQPQGVRHILLVTHPNHMLRARWTFEKAGFTVYPAPVPWDRLAAIWERPSLERFQLFHNVLYEYAGLVLYWGKGWL